MKSNFEFLNKYWPVLAQLGAKTFSVIMEKINSKLRTVF